MAVTLVIGAPSTAAPAAARTAPASADKPPRGALLTTADLPAGYRSADDWNDLARPGEPDPDVCVNPVAVGSVVNRPAISSHATFFRGDDGTLLYEILVDSGAGRARALVASVASAPKRCPAVRLGALTLTVERMSVPDLGTRASGVLVETATGTPIRTRLVVFAAGRLTAVVMAVGTTDTGLRAMHTIALAAARKLAAPKLAAPNLAAPELASSD